MTTALNEAGGRKESSATTQTASGTTSPTSSIQRVWTRRRRRNTRQISRTMSTGPLSYTQMTMPSSWTGWVWTHYTSSNLVRIITLLEPLFELIRYFLRGNAGCPISAGDPLREGDEGLAQGVQPPVRQKQYARYIIIVRTHFTGADTIMIKAIVKLMSSFQVETA